MNQAKLNQRAGVAGAILLGTASVAAALSEPNSNDRAMAEYVDEQKLISAVEKTH